MNNYFDTFNDSFARAIGGETYNDAFISHFYAQFFKAEPSVAKRFANTRMSVQKTMLHDSLQDMVNLAKTHTVLPHMHQLAQAHNQHHHNVPPFLYRHWLDSLIATVKVFDTQFDRPIELAWRMVLAPGISFMCFLYDH